MSAHILIADEHSVVRDGLREMLRQGQDLRVAGEASSGPQALQLARRERFDLIIMEISFSGLSGVKVLEQLRAEGNSVPILFFSIYPPEQYAAYLWRMGANGILGKNAMTAEILGAIAKIIRGQTYFPTLRRKSE